MHSHDVIAAGRRVEGEKLPSALDEKHAHGSVSVQQLKRWAELQEQKCKQRSEHYLDFYKKYDSEPTKPEIELGEIRYSWCLVFDLEVENIEAGAAVGEVLVPVECVDTCMRLWAADMLISCEESKHGQEIFILVGMAYEVQVDEASILGPHMRMQKCKGSVQFSPEFIQYYTPDLFVENPRLATCFTSGQSQRLVWNRMCRLAGMYLEENDRLISKEKSLEFFREALDDNDVIRCKKVRELLATHGGFRPHAKEILGPEVEALAEKVLADPYFSVEPIQTYTKKEQAMLEAQNAHLAARGLKPVTYEEVRKVVDILTEWTSAEPGKSEKYVGSLKFFFALHDHMELEYLQRVWAPFDNLWKRHIYGKRAEDSQSMTYFQEPMDRRHIAMTYIPLDAIRDYFGDQVGLYAAWLQMYTRSLIWPALAGLVVQFAETKSGDIDDNVLVLPYSIYLCIWSAVFSVMWTRRENELKFLWGSEDVEETAPIRPEFVGVMVINSDTGKENVVWANSYVKYLRLLLSTALTLALIGAVMLSSFGATLVAYYDARKLCYEPGNVSNMDDCPNMDACLCARCETVGHGLNATRQIITDIFTETDCLSADDTYTWMDGWPTDYSLVDKKKWEWVSSSISAIMIVVFGMLYEKIALSLNNWENHRTDIEYEDSLITKNFLFQFVNNYFTLFYIAYLRQVTVFGIDAECKSGSCLSALQTQVGFVFTIKTIIAQLKEVCGPFVKHKVRLLADLLRLKQMQKVVTNMAIQLEQLALPNELEKALGVDEETIERSRAISAKKEALEKRLINSTAKVHHTMAFGTQKVVSAQEVQQQESCEIESFCQEYGSTFDDFNEMVIQFGYLALFSPAYPLAPLLAFVNNVIEIRVDASKLCYDVRRPEWELAEDIGSWSLVLQVLGFISVVTNATMVTFVGKRLSDTGWELTPDEGENGLSARLENYKLWTLAVLIEHGVIFARIIILMAIPVLPRWLEDAQDTLRYHTSGMKPAQQILEEKRLHLEFKRKLGVQSDDLADEDDFKESHNVRTAMQKQVMEKQQQKAMRAKEQSMLSPMREGLTIKNPMAISKKNHLKISNPMSTMDNSMLTNNEESKDKPI